MEVASEHLDGTKERGRGNSVVSVESSEELHFDGNVF